MESSCNHRRNGTSRERPHTVPCGMEVGSTKISPVSNTAEVCRILSDKLMLAPAQTADKPLRSGNRSTPFRQSCRKRMSAIMRESHRVFTFTHKPGRRLVSFPIYILQKQLRSNPLRCTQGHAIFPKLPVNPIYSLLNPPDHLPEFVLPTARKTGVAGQQRQGKPSNSINFRQPDVE